MNAPRAALRICLVAVALSACSHALEVDNYTLYMRPRQFTGIDPPITVGVLPYGGPADDHYWHELVVTRMRMDPGFREVRSDYVVADDASDRRRPDLLVSIDTYVRYKSSIANFFINWPGFLIFTPAWHGYVYHAEITTQLTVIDPTGKTLSTKSVVMNYEFRQAEMDRTAFAELSWLEVSIMAFIGGIYNANSFDRDTIPELQEYVRDNYPSYVYADLGPAIAAAAPAVAPTSTSPEEAAPRPPESLEPKAGDPAPATPTL